MLPLRTRVGLGVMAMKEYSAFPKAPALLKPYYQFVLCHFQDTGCGSFTPLQWSSQSILQPQPTWQPCDGIHRRRSLKSSSLFFHQCPSGLVRLIWMILTKFIKRKNVESNPTRMLWAILNKFWKQHPTKQHLHGNLPSISKTIQIRRRIFEIL